jgi:hypothetical protein
MIIGDDMPFRVIDKTRSCAFSRCYAVKWAAKQDWWQAVMLLAAALSLVITVLDYKVAYAGIVVNIVIVMVALINPSVLAG